MELRLEEKFVIKWYLSYFFIVLKCDFVGGLYFVSLNWWVSCEIEFMVIVFEIKVIMIF